MCPSYVGCHPSSSRVSVLDAGEKAAQPAVVFGCILVRDAGHGKIEMPADHFGGSSDPWCTAAPAATRAAAEASERARARRRRPRRRILVNACDEDRNIITTFPAAKRFNRRQQIFGDGVLPLQGDDESLLA